MTFEKRVLTDGGGMILCEPTSVAQMLDNGEIRGLPNRFEKLDWHVLMRAPNTWGDDVRVAVDSHLGLGYATHDGWCQTFRHNGMLEEFVQKMIAVSEGEIEVEDAGLLHEGSEA